MRKPEEEIYKYVLKVLDLSPKNILFIDDLGINLKPAKKLGFHTYKAVNPWDTQSFLEGFWRFKWKIYYLKRLKLELVIYL